MQWYKKKKMELEDAASLEKEKEERTSIETDRIPKAKAINSSCICTTCTVFTMSSTSYEQRCIHSQCIIKIENLNGKMSWCWNKTVDIFILCTTGKIGKIGIML